MKPEVSYLIPGSLEDRNKNIEVAYGHHVTSKQKGKVQLKICDDNRDPFIVMLHNVLSAPDLCNRLFSIIILMNSVHTCLFHKGLCNIYFRAKENNSVTFPHSVQRQYAFLGEIKENVKDKKGYQLGSKLL